MFVWADKNGSLLVDGKLLKAGDPIPEGKVSQKRIAGWLEKGIVEEIKTRKPRKSKADDDDTKRIEKGSEDETF